MHELEMDVVIASVRADAVALDRTCFYAGGGGQPPDHGELILQTASPRIVGMARDQAGVLWHICNPEPQPEWLGQRAQLKVDRQRRAALSRYHTVLHVVNTIAMRDYGAWITGAQIEVDYARIDFKWDGFTPAVTADLDRKVNDVLKADLPIRAFSITEEEFARRPELLRTLEVRPPVVDGHVRVVEIAGFDTQACGGTHVEGTGELGVFRITRTENKGKINKRLYVELATAVAG